MKLNKKKELAARLFGVGKSRIVFLKPRIDEIKEAITKEDIRNLKNDGAIVIKEVIGRRIRRIKRRVGPGSIKKNVRRKKKEYITSTRNLRSYIALMKKQNLLPNETISDIRKKIRNRYFKSRSHLKEYIKSLKK